MANIHEHRPLTSPLTINQTQQAIQLVNMGEKLGGKKQLGPSQEQWKEQIELSTEALTFHYTYKRMCTDTHAQRDGERTMVYFKRVY